MTKISFVFAGALLACALLAPAQSAPKQPASSLLVNVLDRHDNAVRDLPIDDFRVKVNGHPAAVVEAHYNLAPRRIVVLLDMSGSMAGGTEKNRKWQIAREAIECRREPRPRNSQAQVIV